MIDEDGLEVERTDYFPYGQIRSGGTEKYGFTGQENDADTELMYYGARYYSPQYRFFVQPDTLLPDSYNPQALNRYAYALDNPLKYTDPTGHYIESGIDIAFLAMDINDIRTGNADTWTYIGLGTDAVCLALPGVTGGRLAVTAVEEGVSHADDVGELFQFLDKTAGVENKVDNAIDSGKAVSKIDERILNKWSAQSSKTVEDSLDYHYDKHVLSRNIDMSIEEYTTNAEGLFKQYEKNDLPKSAKITETRLSDGTTGIKIVIGPKSNNEMGIFTKDGKIVSYHPKNPER
jgi:RHS repeat-associated protein